MSEEAQAAIDEGQRQVDPLLGIVLNDRFTLLERIGTGGMGRVYRALQMPLDRMVAIKILDTNYAAGRDPNFQKRFFLEASLTSRLSHPNTITVIDYGKTPDGIYFIAMEYVEGQTLAQVLTRQGAFPYLRALHIGQQVCRSLREAHRMGIIHRDLKPANIMLLEEEGDHDRVKVLDFGLVKSIAPEQSDQQEIGITESGTLLGSPLYMAPEHARHQPADARSDIYSLGVVLYQMLVGKPPFSGQSIDVIVKHVHELPKPPRTVRPDLYIPSEVEGLVLKCLEKDPKDRFSSMDEVIDALRAAGASGSVSGPRVAPRRLSGELQATTGGADSDVLSGPRELDLELPLTVEEPELSSTEGTAVARPSRRWTWALAAGVLLAFSSGTLFAFLRWNKSTRAPAVHTPLPPTAAVVKAVPTPVRFQVRSEPLGASVWIAGRHIGTTPLALDVMADEDGTARAQLTFRLEGYLPLTVEASGTGPEVVLTPTFTRRVSAPKADTTWLGSKYKSDPY